MKLNGMTFNQIFATLTDVRSADAFVQELFSKGLVTTMKIGRSQDSAGQITIGSDPIKAFGEVAGSNTFDALTEKFLFENPDVELNSPREAIERRLGFPNGRFDSLGRTSKMIREALSSTRISLVGEVPKGTQPTRTTLDVRDFGIGIRNEAIKETIFGLGGGGKTLKNYLLGAYGQGAKAVYNFTLRDKHGEGNTVQFTATRHVDSDTVSLGIIWYDNRRTTAKTGEWLSLVNPDTMEPWEFPVGPTATFEPGTLTRIFDYEVGAHAAAKFGSSDRDFVNTLRSVLPDPMTPITVRDDRTAGSGNRAWARYLNSERRTHRSYYGSVYDLQHDKKVRSSGVCDLRFDHNETCRLRWYVFDYDAGTEAMSSYGRAETPIVVTLNGQAQGHFPKHLLTRDVGFSALNHRFIAYLETDGLSHLTKRELFSSTRESLKKGSDLNRLRNLLIDVLSSDEQLQHLNEEYRNQNSSRSSGNEDNQVLNILSRYVQSTKSSYKGPKSTPKTREGKEDEVQISEIPVKDPFTLFDFQGAIQRDVTPGQTFRVVIHTDASDELRRRKGALRIDCPYKNLKCVQVSSRKTDHGRMSLLFKVDSKALEGSSFDVSVTLEDVKQNVSQTVSFSAEVQEPLPKPPKDEGLPFRLEFLASEESLAMYDLSLMDVSVMRDEGSERVSYTNMINPDLQHRLDKILEDGRYTNPEDLAYRMKVAYKSEAAISSWESYVESQEGSEDPTTQEALMKRSSKAAFGTLLRATSTVQGLRNVVPETLETDET